VLFVCHNLTELSTIPSTSRGTDQAANSIALKVSRAGDASQDRIAASLEKRTPGGKGRASASTASASTEKGHGRGRIRTTAPAGR
jgi:hypothetical protein